MKTIVLIAAALGVTLLGGCTSYPGGYGYGYYYEPWDGYDGGNGGSGKGSKFSGGGRSEPGNEAGMTPGRPGDGRGSPRPGGASRGGEAGSAGGGSRGGEAGSR
jgi:hypothetical protein